MLDVRKLKALREVALRQSFSEAAERLGYTQSAISQQISQLERQVGTLLIDRRGRGIKLTPAGRALVECADVILRRLDDAESELEAITGIRHGSLRLAASGESPVTWMPTAIRQFRTRHPGVRVAVTVSEPAAAAALVDSGEAEVAVLGMSGDVKNVRLSGSVAAVHLLDDPVRVALLADHRLAGRLSIGLAELAEDPWILPTRTSAVGEVFTDLCVRSSLKPRVAVRLDDCLTVHGMVASGLGVALVPAMVAALSIRPDVVVRPLHSPEPAQRIVAVVRSGIERSPTVAEMLGELQSAAAEWRSTHPVLSRGITTADHAITEVSRP
jgi:DNA-binding transcriptional LysR family regulator